MKLQYVQWELHISGLIRGYGTAVVHRIIGDGSSIVLDFLHPNAFSVAPPPGGSLELTAAPE